MKGVFILGLALALALWVGCGDLRKPPPGDPLDPSPTGKPMVSVKPRNLEPVNVLINLPEETLGSWVVEIGFDPDLLVLERVEGGERAWKDVEILSRRTHGKVLLQALHPQGTQGLVYVAKLHFKALGTGFTTLEVLFSQLYDEQDNPLLMGKANVQVSPSKLSLR